MLTPEQRIAEFLRQHENRRGVDPEELYTIFTDPDAGPATLRASDLRALLAEVKRLKAERAAIDVAVEALDKRANISAFGDAFERGQATGLRAAVAAIRDCVSGSGVDR